MNLKPFNSIGERERRAAGHAMRWPLSGYLAGKERGGRYVQCLEDAWAGTFGVRHAIACNSATSGLMAAAFAVGLKSGDRFLVPAMTMSATAAAPMFTGATPIFCDVENNSLDFRGDGRASGAVFATNLFGHPAELRRLRAFADDHGMPLIEDNAQSPFATEDDKFAGTVGHIGVWSLNIHKPIQCGEGGIITTDDDLLADRMRRFINHGEVGGGGIGLNLRMPEVCAAIARVQLQRGPEIIRGRIAQAEALIDAIGEIPGLRMPVVREGCKHVYYVIPFLIDGDRAKFCAALHSSGVPVVEGYGSGLLYRLPAFAPYARPCPVAEDLHDRRLVYFENCAWDLKSRQIKEIGRAFQKAAEVL